MEKNLNSLGIYLKLISQGKFKWSLSTLNTDPGTTIHLTWFGFSQPGLSLGI